MFKLYKVRFEQDKNQYCDWARKHKRSHDACGGGSRRTGGFAGLPFVGPAGKLLDLLLKAMRIKEDMYYIANIVKCRPPGNRVPTDDEAEMCLPYLRNQLVLVKPRIIVCLGATAMKYIIDRNAKITNVRGQWIERKGYWIIATFHPADDKLVIFFQSLVYTDDAPLEFEIPIADLSDVLKSPFNSLGMGNAQ